MSRLGYLFLLVLISFPLFAEDEKPPQQLIEEQVTTSHTTQIDGKTLNYQATCGNLILKDEKQKQKASIFYVAYTKEDKVNDTNRPITFCFNGGPGSSSVWLHLGLLGPRKVIVEDEKFTPPPYQFIPNENSLLDVTDLVFIDPVSTGFSRPAPGEDPKQFHGFEEDIQAIGEFIRLYVTRFGRWGSPKYLAGESYGTTRAAGLAQELHEEYNLYIDGLILISSILNFQTILDSQQGNDLPYLLYLPTYTATAWYHKKLPTQLQNQPLENVLPQAQKFCAETYTEALFKGDSLSLQERSKVTSQMAHFTGLDPSYIDRSNLRVGPTKFAKELLRDQGLVVGRFDTRVTAYDGSPNGERMAFDPSRDAIFGAFTSALNQYLRDELQWKKDEEYVILADVTPWNFGNAKNQYLNAAVMLKKAMLLNPSLKVFVASGIYDLATPYFATDYTFHHLGLDRREAGRVEMKTYPGGHMMYTNDSASRGLKGDIKRFITEGERGASRDD